MIRFEGFNLNKLLSPILNYKNTVARFHIKPPVVAPPPGYYTGLRTVFFGMFRLCDMLQISTKPQELQTELFVNYGMIVTPSKISIRVSKLHQPQRQSNNQLQIKDAISI